MSDMEGPDTYPPTGEDPPQPMNLDAIAALHVTASPSTSSEELPTTSSGALDGDTGGQQVTPQPVTTATSQDLHVTASSSTSSEELPTTSSGALDGDTGGQQVTPQPISTATSPGAPANASISKSTDLFLIGKTGHGKSMTGSTILGVENAFVTSDGTDSETFDIQVKWGKHLDRVVKVVDGPGLFETRKNEIKDPAKKFIEDMKEGIAQCPLGFHALLLVLKYGNRFTEEEFDTVSTLKTVFGETFVKDFCILIFTHGDNFDANNKKKKTNFTFEEWCQQQMQAMQKLFEECEHRAVLFDNMSDDKAEEQRGQLFKMVDGLKSKGKRYTNEIFREYAEEREKFIVRENCQIISEEIQAKIDFLTNDVKGVMDSIDLDTTTKEQLEQLHNDAQSLIDEIKLKDKGTGVLVGLLKKVENIMNSIKAGNLRKEYKRWDKYLIQLKKEQNKKNTELVSILEGITKSLHSFVNEMEQPEK